MYHPWEDDEDEAVGAVGGAHEWDDESSDDGVGGVPGGHLIEVGSDDDIEFDLDNISPEDAASEFKEMLTVAYMETSISAQLFATLCFFAARAGASITPAVQRYGKILGPAQVTTKGF